MDAQFGQADLIQLLCVCKPTTKNFKKLKATRNVFGNREKQSLHYTNMCTILESYNLCKPAGCMSRVAKIFFGQVCRDQSERMLRLGVYLKDENKIGTWKKELLLPPA